MCNTCDGAVVCTGGLHSFAPDVGDDGDDTDDTDDPSIVDTDDWIHLIPVPTIPDEPIWKIDEIITVTPIPEPPCCVPTEPGDLPSLVPAEEAILLGG